MYKRQVADGVGGHNAGEIASSLATEMAAVYVKHHPLRRVRNDEELKQYFLDCLREANESVVRVANQRDAKAGMATTALICYIATGKAYMVNVGDSRGYLVRDGKMMQVTEDRCV